jgi:hypothetical protein
MPRKKKPETEIIDLSKGEKSVTYRFEILVPESRGQIARQLAGEKVIPPLSKYVADAVQAFHDDGARKYAEALNYLKREARGTRDARPPKRESDDELLLENLI